MKKEIFKTSSIFTNINNRPTMNKFNKKDFSKVLVFATLVLISSCSVKKGQNVGSVANVLSIEERPNSSGDGVPDDIKIQRGSSPYIAEVPFIHISSVDQVSISGTYRTNSDTQSFVSKDIILPQKFTKIDSPNATDKDYLKVLRRKVLVNQVSELKNIDAPKEDTIQNEDLRASILSQWENEIYFSTLDSLLSIQNPIDNETGKVSMSFKIKVNGMKGVSEISNIKLKTFFYNHKKMEENDIYTHSLLKDDGTKEKINVYNDTEANPVSTYKIITTDLNTSLIADNIKSRNEIGIKILDFDYVSSGITLNYSTVLQKILDHDAKIIFSDGLKTEIFFVAPQFTFEEALKMLGKKVVKDARGGIFSVNGIETNANLPIDFDNVSKKDFDSGVWSIIGNADSLTDKLVEKGFYVISYATVKDLLDASKTEQKYPESTDVFSSFVSLEKATEGDEVSITVLDLMLKSYTESISNEEKTQGGIECFNGPPHHQGGCGHFLPVKTEWASCTIVHSTAVQTQSQISPNQDNLKKIIGVKNELGDDVDFSAFYAGNIVKIVFDKPLPMQRNNLKVYFKNPSPPQTARNGVISNSCGGNVSYSTISYQPSYVFKKDVTIFSQTKY